MAQPYVGEMRMFAGNFAPVGWMFCDGQLLPISENETLFNLIGTTYGGDGESTFALPDLRGRLPLHMGPNHQLAETGGVEEVTLTTGQIPQHSHALLGSSANGAQAAPANNILATSVVITPYTGLPTDTQMAASSLTPVGGSQPHNNLQPFLCVNFIISLFGLYPQPT